MRNIGLKKTLVSIPKKTPVKKEIIKLINGQDDV